MELGKAGKETVVIHSVERELLRARASRTRPGRRWPIPSVSATGWAASVELDPVPGGDFHIRFDDGEERTGFVEELDPDAHRFAFWWRPPEDDVATRVEISLDETDEGTLVRVVETSPMATLDLRGHPAAEPPQRTVRRRSRWRFA